MRAKFQLLVLSKLKDNNFVEGNNLIRNNNNLQEQRLNYQFLKN
jgi:hypothetical protein